MQTLLISRSKHQLWKVTRQQLFDKRFQLLVPSQHVHDERPPCVAWTEGQLQDSRSVHSAACSIRWPFRIDCNGLCLCNSIAKVIMHPIQNAYLLQWNRKRTSQAHVHKGKQSVRDCAVQNLSSTNRLPTTLRPIINEESAWTTVSRFIAGQTSDDVHSTKLTLNPRTLFRRRTFAQTAMGNSREDAYRDSKALDVVPKFPSTLHPG
mmetsp:Transcript_137910/g.239760  ORF Transcript_137910/g.239760 Transcript_137910/m.239760 type:complete len:207 (-) Transcript_137910:2431-3051(-)